MASTISITYKFQGDSKTLKELANDAEGLKKAFSGVAVEAEQLPKKCGGIGSLTKSLGGLAAGFLSAKAAFGVLKNAVGTMKDFERANSTLASVLGKSADDIKGLTKAAMDLGRVTEFTASEVTELQTALARLGFTEGQITDMQESVLKFASAVGADLASAADFSGSALRAFGLEAGDSKALLDIMAASTSKSALSFSKLQTSIATVGPVAHAFGLSARDTVSLLGVLSNAGFDATSAATALRNILLNLADSNGKLARGLGHTAKTMPEIMDALKELKDRGVDLNETLAMTDKRSVAAFNAMLDGEGNVRDLYDALGDCDGALDQMYRTMTDNLEGATKSLASAWEGLVLQFKDSTGPMKDVVQELTNILNGLTDLLGRKEAKKAEKAEDIAAQAESYVNRVWSEYGGDVEKIQARIAEDMAKASSEASKAVHESIQKGNKQLQKDAKDRLRLWIEFEEVLRHTNQPLMDRIAFEGAGSVSGTKTTNGNSGGGGGGGGKNNKKTKGLTEAIQDYNESVLRAIQLNKELGYKQTDQEAQLDAMKSGLTSLINKYGTESEAVQQLIADYKELLTARRGAKAATAIDLTGIPTVTGPGASIQGKTAKKKGMIPGLVGTDLSKYRKEAGKAMSQTEALQTTVGALAGVFRDLAGAVGESASAWLEWGSNLLSAIAQALPQLTALFVKQNAAATANTAAAASGGASAVASIPYVGPVLAVAAVASILAALASLPKFAKGGVVSGPTFGLMGEYAGATHNPEVIAPLNTLRQYIQTDTSLGPVDFRIRGRDLVGVSRKEGRRRSRG